MRMTVEDLIKELSTKNPKAHVDFQTSVDQTGNRRLHNGVARVDDFGCNVTVVVEHDV